MCHVRLHTGNEADQGSYSVDGAGAKALLTFCIAIASGSSTVHRNDSAIAIRGLAAPIFTVG